MSVFNCKRRRTTPVVVGNLQIGGDSPVRIQSMASTSTLDTAASLDQSRRIIDAGAELLRFTAQGVREAANLENIKSSLRAEGYATPLVADIHFNPRAAFEAARHVEKVRINPGNFVDPGRTFRKIEYTPEEYAAELAKIDQALTPFLKLCSEKGVAIRLGVNHGSLSDRIMSRYGDTPQGMVESAMEFLRVCRRNNFDNVVISIKASNVLVMVSTVRMLVSAMDAEQMAYPLHLGVTEAGDGEDGRVKSAVGIGALLSEGIGDTIRVSLSEPPECEVPVAKAIVAYVESKAAAPGIEGSYSRGYDPVNPAPRKSIVREAMVVAQNSSDSYDYDYRPDLTLDDGSVEYVMLDASDPIPDSIGRDAVIILSSDHANQSGHLLSALHRIADSGIANPVITKLKSDAADAETAKIQLAVDAGAILLAGFTDGLMIDAQTLSAAESARLAFTILQSARLRITHTEYISCPGCGRTLFDLQTTLKRVKDATSHLKGLKIGVMGCIVNGPGEMADADYGYVGAGSGRVSLYKGKECVEKNIPAEDAVERLISLIKKCGDWK